MLEMKKRIPFFTKFSEVIDLKFISDEIAFQGLSIGIISFSFFSFQIKLLKKENRTLLVKFLKIKIC